MRTATAVNKLLAVITLAGCAVSPFVAQSYSRNFGKISGVPPEYTEAEHPEYLKDAGGNIPSSPNLISPEGGWRGTHEMS